MSPKIFLVVSIMVIAASPLAAAQPEPSQEASAPAAPADARYCIHLEPVTGSRIETVRCETRASWVELGLDIDKEWAKEGVAVIS